MEKAQFAELNAFAAVLQHGSFVRAALHLGVAPPALSQTIKKLEERLGLRLLNRTTRSVSPTAEGERLASRLVPALGELEASVASLDDVRDTVRGTVRINTPRLVASRILLPQLARFHAEYPEIALDLTTDETFTDIVASHFDVGIRLGERLQQDVVAVKIGPDFEMTAVATPRYLKTRGTPKSPRDLVNHDCINWRGPTTGAVYRWEFERRGRAFEIGVTGPVVTNDAELLVDAALAGLGIAYVTDAESAGYRDSGRLVRILAPWSPRFAGFFLYYPHRQRLSRHVRAFVDFMRDAPWSPAR